MPLKPERQNIPITGGLSQDETPEYLDPGALFECDNFWHLKKTGLTKRYGYDIVTVVQNQGHPTGSFIVDNIIPFGDGIGVDGQAPIDRFIACESNAVAFAARGWLWAYDPAAFTISSISPKPNTIRVGQIPDIQIKQEQIVGVDSLLYSNPVADISQPILSGFNIKESASCVSTDNIKCTTYIAETASGEELHALIIDGNNDITLSDTYLKTYQEYNHLTHPCVVASDGVFLATAQHIDGYEILAYKFNIPTLAWEAVTWPTVIAGGSVTISQDYYDMCIKGTTEVAVVQNSFHRTSMWGTSGPSGGGSIDINDLFGALVIYTVDIASMSITHGPFFLGQNSWIGGFPWPVFGVGSSPINGETKYSGAFYGSSSSGSTTPKKTYFKAFDDDSVGATVQLDTDQATRIGVGSIQPFNSLDQAKWNVVWQKDLDVAGPMVRSRIYDHNTTILGSDHDYYSTTMATCPFGTNGNSYIIVIPNLLLTTDGNNQGDVPWILSRTHTDQEQYDQNDNVEFYHNQARPMAIWGYGTAFFPQFASYMPGRFGLDATGLKAFGSLITQDVFTPSYGNGIVNITADPTGPDRYDSIPLPGGGSAFGCSNPWIFDDENVFECGFVMKPVLLGTSIFSGGRLEKDVNANDFHFIKLIYEAQDAKGRVYQSPVSPTYKVKVTGSDGLLQLKVSQLFWTARKDNTVRVKVYMCRDNINFALVTTANNPPGLEHTPPDDFFIYVTDETIPGGPDIYTFDGTQESGYPQLASHMIRWNNRVWIANDHDLSYSQSFVSGMGLSFPDVFTEEVDRVITALTPLDDRMLLFSTDAVLYRSGEGPAPNGQGNSYSAWNFLTHEIGTTNSRSVFHTIPGVFFQSRRGIEMMTEGGQFVHQRGVENYFKCGSDQASGDTIVGVLSLPRDHHARFLYKDSNDEYVLKQLIYDYSTGTWSRWLGTAANTTWYGDFYTYHGDIQVVGDNVYLADASGKIIPEAYGRFYDCYIAINEDNISTHNHIDWSIISPWIKMEGLQGVQRVWRSNLALKSGYWVQPTYSGAPTPTLGLNTSISVDYGDKIENHPGKSQVQLESIKNTGTNIVYIMVGHQYQACRSFQIQMSSSDTQDYDNTVNISGIYEFLGWWTEFGIEQGTGRLPADNKI